MSKNTCQPAIVTGASSGIDYELAKLCAGNGYDLIVAAVTPSGVLAEQHLKMAEPEPGGKS